MDSYNPNPTVYAPSASTRRRSFGPSKETSLWVSDYESDESVEESEEPEPIDQNEIFDLIRHISDPEHPNMTLEQLMVVSAPQVAVMNNHVAVEFTPTVPHCGASTLIGLSIRVRLLRSLPQRYKIDIRVKPGSHQSEHAVNKQLNDKERVAAALENSALLDVVEGCLATASRNGSADDDRTTFA